MTVTTLDNWRKSVDAGLTHLVRAREPWNRLVDLVREIAHAVRRERPRWGSRRVAGILANLGLAASRRSVQRILRRPPPRPRRPRATACSTARAIRPCSPNHVWYIDFTQVKAFMGIVTLTVGAVIDGFSRKVLALDAWSGGATAGDACRLVDHAIRAAGLPCWLVCDHGTQFTAASFRRFLSRRKIRRRFGAVAHPQSIGRIERFWRSLKAEWADPFLALHPLARIRRELALYRTWFNAHRVHTGLGGRMPGAVFAARPLRRALRPKPGERFALCLRYLAGNRKLPVFTLRRAA